MFPNLRHFSVPMALAILAFGPIAASAQSIDQLIATCNNDAHSAADASIAACTALIRSGGVTNPDSTYLHRANAYKAKGDFSSALRDYNEAIRLNPSESTNFDMRGALYRDLKQYDQADQDFQRAIQMTPEDPVPYYNRGSMEVAEHQYQKAMDDFSRTIANASRVSNSTEEGSDSGPLTANSMAANAYNYRGLAWKGLGNFNQALEDFNTAIELDASYYGFYLNRGILKTDNLGRAADAISDYNSALALDIPEVKRRASLLNDSCWARALANQLPPAVQDCLQSIQLNNSNENTFDSLGLVYLKMGRLLDALAVYNAALRIDGKMASSLYGRGVAKIQAGNTVRGRDDIDAAKKIEANIADEFAGWGVPAPNPALLAVNRPALDADIIPNAPQPEMGSVAAEVLEDVETTEEFVYLAALYKDKSSADSAWPGSTQGVAMMAELTSMRNDALQTRIVPSANGRILQYSIGGKIIADAGVEAADLEKSRPYRVTIETAISENILTEYSFPGFPGRTKP